MAFSRSLSLSFLILCLHLFHSARGEDCLSEHNSYRYRHGVPPLLYDRTLEQFATKRAQYMAATDIFAHPPRLPYGENLYWRSGRAADCKSALSMWYNEDKWYNYESGRFSPSTGHFTQMIWKSTNYVGCASAKSRRSGRIYIACNYYPPGNVRGQFKGNVPRARCVVTTRPSQPDLRPEGLPSGGSHHEVPLIFNAFLALHCRFVSKH